MSPAELRQMKSEELQEKLKRSLLENVEAALELAVLAERKRCIQIATLSNMAVKDIVRVIQSGEWIKPDNG